MRTKKRAVKPNPVGRPTIRTPAIAQILCECIARGMPYVHACGTAGISRSVFDEWKREDEGFRQQIEQAIAQGVNERLKTITEASSTDWRAAPWLLEHFQPQHLAQTRIEMTPAA